MVTAEAAQRAAGDAVSVGIGDAPITLEALQRSVGRRLRPIAGDAVVRRLAERRAALERLAGGTEAVYGVNTGFGPLCRQSIGPQDLERLQDNLVMSHAVGVGPPVCDGIVRLMLWFKLHALGRGYSGVSPAAFESLRQLLERDVLPEVPSRGSLGASGDLAPLAHLSLPLLGRGFVRVEGQRMPAAEGLAKAGLAPVRLGPKDGLALLNGTQFITANGADAVVRAAQLARQADVVATMSLEALRGSAKPFDARLHEVRPHPGAVRVAACMRALLQDSEIVESHRDCGKVQDPYSLRCIPAVHGACRDALAHATEVLLREINSVTDNPVLFDGEAVSGGNFHAEPVALVLDYLTMALCEWASISERRIFLLLGGHDGLPPVLVSRPGLNSGLMMLQYTAAALVNECKVLSHPASTDSIPTAAGQEDHVSMGAAAALKCREVAGHAETVLALELLCAAQALDFRMPLKAGRGVQAAYEFVRRRIEHVTDDREYGPDLAVALEALRGGEIAAAAEAVMGPIQ